MTIPNIFTWNGDVLQPTYQDTGDPMFIEHTREAGIYGALRLNPIDGVKLIAGGRYTDWKTATDDYDITSLLTAPTTWRKEKRFNPYLGRSEEHTSELQSLMRISYAVFCLKKKIKNTKV